MDFIDLTPEEFDQYPGKFREASGQDILLKLDKNKIRGWRKYEYEILNKQSKGLKVRSKDFLEIANIIKFYLNNYTGEYPTGSKGLILWHCGQHFAFAGDYKQAIVFFEKIVSGEHPFDVYYTKATICFLNRDKEGIVRILESISNDVASKGYIQRLLDGFNSPY